MQRDRHLHREVRPGRDAQWQGTSWTSPPADRGEDRRGGRGLRGGHGALERVPADIRDPGRGRPHELTPRWSTRSTDGRLDPGHGQGPHRPFRRGPGAPGYRCSTATSTSPRCCRRPTRRYHIDKGGSPCRSCAGTNLGEALRRIAEARRMIRSEGRGRHRQRDRGGPRTCGRSPAASAACHGLRADELTFTAAKELGRPLRAGRQVAAAGGRLPVLCHRPAGSPPRPMPPSMDASAGADGVFVGSGIFVPGPRHDGARRRGHHELREPRRAGEALPRPGRDLMAGLEISKLETRLQDRGW